MLDTDALLASWKGKRIDLSGTEFRMLAKLVGIEKKVWLQVEGCDKVFPIANEDLDRETGDKTSAVHFLRFELTPQKIAAAKGGAALHAGIDHAHYREAVVVPEAVRASLVTDLA